MKRSRFSEEQIIGILRENEAGVSPGALARKHGVSQPTIYAWKSKFRGRSVSIGSRVGRLAQDASPNARAAASCRVARGVITPPPAPYPSSRRLCR